MCAVRLRKTERVFLLTPSGWLVFFLTLLLFNPPSSCHWLISVWAEIFYIAFYSWSPKMYASAFYKCQDIIEPMWLLYFFLVTMFWEYFPISWKRNTGWMIVNLLFLFTYCCFRCYLLLVQWWLSVIRWFGHLLSNAAAVFVSLYLRLEERVIFCSHNLLIHYSVPG